MHRTDANVMLSYAAELSCPSAFRGKPMNFEGVGEIVASRQLYFFDETNRKRIVSLFVGKPQPARDWEDYQCLFQLIGVGNQETQVAHGHDSLEALRTAIILAAANLNHLNDKLGRRLVWEGGDKGDLGFL
jgi:uncharacterized protein DUF6968